MKFHTGATAPVNTDFTGLQGYIQATKRELVKAFGLPDQIALDKSSTYWSIRFEDGTIATVYDYFRNGAAVVAPGLDDVIGWHVGGHNRQVDLYVHQALRDALGMKARAA